MEISPLLALVTLSYSIHWLFWQPCRIKFSAFGLGNNGWKVGVKEKVSGI